jgi:hypothetical protein
MSNNPQKPQLNIGAVMHSNKPEHGNLVIVTDSDDRNVIGFVGRLCLKWETYCSVLSKRLSDKIDYPCFAVIGENESWVCGKNSFMKVERYCA